jgi:hypothetical protein
VSSGKFDHLNRARRPMGTPTKRFSLTVDEGTAQALHRLATRLHTTDTRAASLVVASALRHMERAA